jgi:hypothetical protein
MRARVIEMEAEAAKLRELQEEEAKASDGPPSDGIVANAVEEDPAVVDGRSIYVGNVRRSLRAGSGSDRRETGRLWRDAGGGAAALYGVRHHQPGHHPL